MAFRVEISPRAFADVDEIAQYIREQASFDHAEAWFNGIIAAIRGLEALPNRCPLADVSEDLGQEVHVLLFGKRNRRYRVYYSIQKQTTTTGKVSIFHVRHWARKSVTTDQMQELKGAK